MISSVFRWLVGACPPVMWLVVTFVDVSFSPAISHDAQQVFSPRHSAGSFTGTLATWEAWKQTKYTIKYISSLSLEQKIMYSSRYLQLEGYSGWYSGSCKRTAISNHSFHIFRHIWEMMNHFRISPLINVVDRWPCTTTTWTSIPVYQDEARQLCPTSWEIMHRGGGRGASRSCGDGEFWTSLLTPSHGRICGEIVTLHMKYHWWYGWYVYNSWIFKEGFNKRTTISLRRQDCTWSRCHSGSQHCATMMSSSWTPNTRDWLMFECCSYLVMRRVNSYDRLNLDEV